MISLEHLAGATPAALDATRDPTPSFYGKYLQSNPMAKVSFEASDEDRALMKAHPEVNWSETFRRTIHQRVRMEAIAQALMEEDEDPRVRSMAKELRGGVGRRFRDARRS